MSNAVTAARKILEDIQSLPITWPRKRARELIAFDALNQAKAEAAIQERKSK